MTDRQVFVLGAGFTKAFVRDAPLLVDDYQIDELLDRFRGLKHAEGVLRAAVAHDTQFSRGHRVRGQSGPPTVDLEALLTRLTGMPYDSEEARPEFAVLEAALLRKLVSRIRTAKDGDVDRGRLDGFARFILESRASIVTFNYDDVLDQSLWEVHRYVRGPVPSTNHWHPDGGYGFFCRPSDVCVTARSIFMDQPSTLLLKLHGSMNWRSRLGEPAARGPSALLHHEGWFQRQADGLHPVYALEEIEKYLEPDPFLIPPVQVKAGLSLHPVLRVIWNAAAMALRKARRVVFIGYSLPETDLAAKTLFGETLNQHDVEVHVVCLAKDKPSRDRLRNSYGKVIPRIAHARFDFTDAALQIEREYSA